MDELNPSNDVLSEYARAGGIHGIAAKELLELLTQTDCDSRWTDIAALVPENGPSLSPETWWQTLEVAGKIFNIQDVPEPESALSALTEQQPRHLLTLAMLLLADFYESAEPPLPECIRGAFGIFLTRLQFNRLVNQVVAGNDAETHALKPREAAIVNMQAGIRSIQSAKAKAPRPRNPLTLTNEFKKAMRHAKCNGETLGTFISSVEVGSISGLGLRRATGRGAPGYDLQSDAGEEYRAHETVYGWWKAIKVG